MLPCGYNALTTTTVVHALLRGSNRLGFCPSPSSHPPNPPSPCPHCPSLSNPLPLSGSSTGLHHDFHDNLYVLLRGRKRFRLYPPSAAPSMYVRGKITRTYPNGRIVYEEQGNVMADGAGEMVVWSWGRGQGVGWGGGGGGRGWGGGARWAPDRKEVAGYCSIFTDPQATLSARIPAARLC